jgi:IS30 family transposase
MSTPYVMTRLVKMYLTICDTPDTAALKRNNSCTYPARTWRHFESSQEYGPHTSIHCLLAHHGGIVPAVRRRAVLALSLVEREDISRGLASGSSIRDIAKGLERAVSTVSREVAHHGGRPFYRAQEADHQAWESALRPKHCLLALHVKLRKLVASKLMLDWSSQQISGWLKVQYPADESMRVSHETIYRSLFIQARGVLKKELLGRLRSKRRIHRSQHARIFKDSRGQIVDAISIRERPAEIEDRAVPGHWEGDLIGGTKNSHIATLVERYSRFTALVKVRSKDTAAVIAALSRQIRRLPHIPAALVDLGSRVGDGQTQNLHGSHERERLLL